MHHDPVFYKPEASRTVAVRLARGGASSAFVAALAAVVAVASHAALARLLGTEEYGAYAVALSALAPIALLANLGFDTAVIRFTASYRRAEQWWPLARLLRYADRLSLVGSAVLIVLAGAAWAIGTAMETAHQARLASVLALGAIVPFEALLNLRSAALQGCGALVRARLPDGVLRPLLAVTLTAALANFRGHLQAAEALLLMAAATAVTLALSHRWLGQQLPRTPVPDDQPDPAWLDTALPMLRTGLLRLVGRAGDVLVVGALLGVREAALYAAASRLCGLVLFAQNSLSGMSAPMLAEHFWQGEIALVERTLAISRRWALAWAGLACAVLVAGGGLLLGLWGDEFRGAWPVLVALALGQLFNAASGPVGYLLNMTGLQRTATLILAVVVPARLLTLPFAITHGGALGAAIASAAWNGIQSLVTWRLARRHLAAAAKAIDSPT